MFICVCIYIYIVNTLININVIKNMIFEYQILGHNYSRNLNEVAHYLHLHRLVLKCDNYKYKYRFFVQQLKYHQN